MNDKQFVLDVLNLVNGSDLMEVEVEDRDSGFRLKVSRRQVDSAPIVQAPISTVTAVAGPAPAVATQSATPMAEAKPVSNGATATAKRTKEVKSPMVGTFYRASGPDRPSFVNVGDIISVGQVVCIIEAMKLFNEIESDVAGRVVEIMPQNADPVNYDDTLLVVELLD